jgi:hypothetical protein
MSTPTYQVVGFGGKTNVSPLQIPLSTTFIGTLNIKKATLSPVSSAKGSAFFGTVQWGNPAAKANGAVPIVLDKNDFAYNWRFFYPSNGKIPGSPIPNYGQLLPRPL